MGRHFTVDSGVSNESLPYNKKLKPTNFIILSLSTVTQISQAKSSLKNYIKTLLTSFKSLETVRIEEGVRGLKEGLDFDSGELLRFRTVGGRFGGLDEKLYSKSGVSIPVKTMTKARLTESTHKNSISIFYKICQSGSSALQHTQRTHDVIRLASF